LSFEENEGQTAREVRYVSHGSGYELFLTPQEAVVALQPSLPVNLSALHGGAYFRSLRQARQAGRMTVLRMGLEGANLEAKISGIDPLPGKVNYFLGNEPEHWHTNIPTYSQVKYAQVYPGVDLVFYGNQRNLEYDFVVAPGADPKAIALTLKGARKVGVDSNGDLILSLANGQVIFQKPVLYQNVRGQRKQIEGSYSLAGKQRVTFAVSKYDRSEPLIIDPVLNYSTYLGGSVAGDAGSAIAVDSLGDAFVTGITLSTTFPTHNGFGAGNANGVAFVTELNPAGTALLYSTYLGGTGGDFGHGIALDTSGNIYVVGQTFSTDFPTNSTITALKPTSAGAASGTSFISKINPALSGIASLVYSSYLGGTNGTSGVAELANSVAADASGNAYVTGYTASSPGSGDANFPITAATAFQTTLGFTAGNAFLTKIDTTQNGALSLIYSTYLGGNGANATTSGLGFGDFGQGVALDSSKNAYITGTTTSTNFPTTSTALQPNTAPPAAVAMGTAFLTRIDTTQPGVLVYSTYLGGDVNDFGLGIAVKPNSTIAYVTGSTSSPAYPTFPANTYQAAAATSFPAAFVSLIDTALPKSTALNYSTFLGGAGTTPFAIAVDAAGNAYVGGLTNSTSFPVTLGAFQPTMATGAQGEGFISKINPGGNGTADLVYSTFFGGSGMGAVPDAVNGIAVDNLNNAYITGVTFSSSATFPVFPPASATTPAFQTSLPSGDTSAAFVAKLTLIPTLTVSPTSLNFGTVLIPSTSPAQTVTLTNNTNAAITFTSAVMNGSPAAANTDYMVTNSCSGSIPFGATNTCTVSVTFKPTVVGSETATLQLTDIDSTSPQNIALTGTGANPAPAVGLTPTSLTFGSQLLNTTSAAQTVTLTNTGTAPLTIISITASGDFTETSTGASACPITPPATPLAAGANCTISVTFTPTATGARTGTLTITDSASGSPHTVGLTGTGTNTPADFTLGAAPTTVTVAQGAVSTPVTITVNPTNGFNSAVALTCAGAPVNSTCALSPVSITPPTTSALTFTAHAMLVPLPMTKPAPPLNMLRIVPLFFVLMLLFLLRSTERFRTRLAMVSAIIICVTLAACSGPNSPNNKTAKGSYPLTITGTSGALTHNATVTVTVN
jgi:P pilus assembly chaperone PapD